MAEKSNSVGRKLLFGGMFLLFGGLLPLLMIEELQVPYVSGTEPVRMTCAETDALRACDNRYVTLTDAWPCPFFYEVNRETDPWQSVLVPVGPPADGARYAEPSTIRVVVISFKIKNNDDLARAFATGEVTGVLVRRGWSHNPTLIEGNPGIQLAKCWQLRLDSPPGTMTFPLFVLGACGLLFCGGMLLIFSVTDRPLPTATAGVLLIPFVLVGYILACLLRGLRQISTGTLTAIFLVAGPSLMFVGGLLFYRYLNTAEGMPYLSLLLAQLGFTMLAMVAYLLLVGSAPAEDEFSASSNPQAANAVLERESSGFTTQDTSIAPEPEENHAPPQRTPRQTLGLGLVVVGAISSAIFGYCVGRQLIEPGLVLILLFGGAGVVITTGVLLMSPKKDDRPGEPDSLADARD